MRPSIHRPSSPRAALAALALALFLGGCGDDGPGTPRRPGPDGLVGTIELGYVGSLAFNPAATAQLALHRGLKLDLFDLDAQARVHSTELADPRNCSAYTPSSVACSHRGQLLAAGPHSDIYLVNAFSGAIVDTLPAGWELSSFRSVAFSPDDQTLYVGTQGGVLSAWGLRPKRLLYRVNMEDPYDAGALALSPDGSTLALSGFGRRVALWSTAEAVRFAELDMDSTFTTDMEFSPDGRTLAVTGSYQTVVLWELATRTVKWVKPGLKFGSAVAVGFSPDGRYLVTNLTPADLSLLDVETGAVLSQWRTHNDSEILDIAWSRDGRLIAASSHQNVKVWDVATRLALGK